MQCPPLCPPAPLAQKLTGMAKSGRKVDRRLGLLCGGIRGGCAYGLAASRAKGGGMPMPMPMGRATGGGGTPEVLAVRMVGGGRAAAEAVRKVGGGTRGA